MIGFDFCIKTSAYDFNNLFDQSLHTKLGIPYKS